MPTRSQPCSDRRRRRPGAELTPGVVRVGVSGWQYPSWRGVYYPPGLVHRQELRYVTERMTVVEVNATFYRLQKPDTFRAWRTAAAPGAVLAVKGSRYITHLKRLREVEVALATFFASGVLELGPRLGPFLWQLPASHEFDEAVLEAFLALLPRTPAAAGLLAARRDRVASEASTRPGEVPARLRHAVEARHPSFGSAAARAVLTRHQVALVAADSAHRFPTFLGPTAPFAYVRLHGARRLYASGYTASELEVWARRVRSWSSEGRDVYVCFDNDAEGRAPFDAEALMDRLGLRRSVPSD
jgi:uncharacterized protein YecE (DUF72 family)